VIESPTLWTERLPKKFSDRAPHFPQAAGAFQAHPGGWDPNVRLQEMAVDGVSVEVLYPTLALSLFHLQEAELQEACFRVYNDWLAEYCSVSPERLIGVASISVYDIDHAVAEMERCRNLGMKGVTIWQVPPEPLAFYTDHYERLWSAAQDLHMPVNLHILTGHDWSRRIAAESLGMSLSEEDSNDPEVRLGAYGFRGMTNYKLLGAANALHDVIVSGVLQRFPEMKLVFVEAEIGWIPFVLDQWDKYYARPARYVDIDMAPSEFFERQVFATFFNDKPGAKQFSWWGTHNCMWSNDFPHPNSTWPNSAEVVMRDIGNLPSDAQARLAWENCARLYELDY
jgi:predicted TIM-barrel fold metal-dependent hydrolase